MVTPAVLLACIDRFGLSMRAFGKLMRVSRTVADSEGAVRGDLPPPLAACIEAGLGGWLLAL